MGTIAYISGDVSILEERAGEYLSKYDWFQVTVSLDGWSDHFDKETGEIVPKEHAFVSWLQHEFTMCDVRHGRGSNSFEYRADLVRGDRVLASVQWGGVNPDPNITATGQDSGLLRHIIRSKFPDGKVSRVDSAFDSLSGTAKFQEVAAWLEGRAAKAGVNTTWIRNSDPNKGDTLYVGSNSSRVQIRLYEKGKQMAYRPGEWWRAEVQLRPDTRSKESTYYFSPGMVWSATRITRDLWEYLGGEKLGAANFQGVQEVKDLETRALHLVKQYGNLLKELVQEYGTGSAVMEELDRISEQLGKGRILPQEPGERG